MQTLAARPACPSGYKESMATAAAAAGQGSGAGGILSGLFGKK
jgi:hypothetical protein